jgi:Holliday junction resolvase RusA-like endonuclease
MAKHLSFIAKNVNPLSQNNRSLALIARLSADLVTAHNQKYLLPNMQLPRTQGNYILEELAVKAFYIHKVKDKKDADNISKPLWDSLNKCVYKDDNQIKYLETLKIKMDMHPDIIHLDLTNIDSTDFVDLVDFVLNPNNPLDRMLYISISDYESKNVRF